MGEVRMKSALLVCVFVAIWASSAEAVIAIRQSASAKVPDQRCDQPRETMINTCTPTTQTSLTVTFQATIPGSVLRAYIYNLVNPETCTDNLGQSWTQNYVSFAPPTGRSS